MITRRGSCSHWSTTVPRQSFHVEPVGCMDTISVILTKATLLDCAPLLKIKNQGCGLNPKQISKVSHCIQHWADSETAALAPTNTESFSLRDQIVCTLCSRGLESTSSRTRSKKLRQPVCMCAVMIICFHELSKIDWQEHHAACLGRLTAIDAYLAMLPLTLHQGNMATVPFLTRLTSGLGSVTMVSAMQLPGLLVQASLALVIRHMICAWLFCSTTWFWLIVRSSTGRSQQCKVSQERCEEGPKGDLFFLRGDPSHGSTREPRKWRRGNHAILKQNTRHQQDWNFIMLPTPETGAFN